MHADPSDTRSLIGRADELARLIEATGLARGTSGLVVLSGDAGIGKTRTLAELAGRAESAGRLVVWGRCIGQGGSELPYLPFSELLHQLADACPEIVDEAVRGHPRLGDLLSNHGGTGGTDGMESSRLAEGVHALLTLVGRSRPLLVIVEDTHWSDDSSRDLLTLLFTRGFATPVSLVASYRSDDLHRRHPLRDTLVLWSRLTRRVDLGPLDRASMRELVSSLSRGPVEDEQVEELVRRAEGNAFYAEELAAASSMGQGVGDDLTRLLRVRVEQLDPAAQQVVRLASVAGRRVGHELLAGVAGLAEAELDQALRQAIEHHVLVPKRDGYYFRHALLSETEYEDLLPGERTRAHRRYAAVIAADPALGTPADLARHAAAAGDTDTAIRASVEAGEAALAIGGPREALRQFERALRLLADDDPRRDHVTLRAALAASHSGNPMRAVELRRDRLDNPAGQLARDRAHLLAMLVMDARATEMEFDGLAMTAEALGLIGPDRDPLRVWVQRSHVQMLTDAARYEEASELGDETMVLAQELRLEVEMGEIKAILARSIESVTHPHRAIAYLESLVTELDGTRAQAQVRAQYQLGSLYAREGRMAEAIEQFDVGTQAATRLGIQWAPWGQECRLMGAVFCYEDGCWDEALERVRVAEPPPQPGEALLRAVEFGIAVARGDATTAELSRLRQWWDLEGLLVVLTAAHGIDLHGDHGDVGAALNLYGDATATLTKLWGPGYQFGIRLAATMLGQLASAMPRTPQAERAELLKRVEWLNHRVETLGTGEDEITRTRNRRLMGPEAVAWLARARAETQRARWLAGSSVDAETLRTVWEETVRLFAAYGHRYETARSRVRLAEVLTSMGDPRAAEVAAWARRTAEELGARVLLDQLGGQRTPGPGLTARETEILVLVAQGKSNADIGRQLFITAKTVSVHVSNAMAKLGAANRGEAASIAARKGILPQK